MVELLFYVNQIEQTTLLQFHTDLRSPKVDILKKNKKASLVFYDKEEKDTIKSEG